MASIDITPGPAEIARSESLWSKILYYAGAYPLGVVGAGIMFVFVCAAIFAGFISPYDPIRTNAAISLAMPSEAHIRWAATS